MKKINISCSVQLFLILIRRGDAVHIVKCLFAESEKQNVKTHPFRRNRNLNFVLTSWLLNLLKSFETSENESTLRGTQ